MKHSGGIFRAWVTLGAAGFALGCSAQTDENFVAFVGAKLIDGTGATPIENAVLIVQAGRVVAVGAGGKLTVPEGATVVAVAGKVIMPGLINGHGHVGATEGLSGGRYSRENVQRDLALNARYGVTTVLSLGGDGLPSIEMRGAQNSADLSRSRLFVAGDVVTGKAPKEAVAMVDYNIGVSVDYIKLKVDGEAGSPQRMVPAVFQAVIRRAHAVGYPVAAHLFYLEDARALVAAGVDLIAHSIRDQVVDDAFIAQMKQGGVGYCPTLMRDVSTFVYESEPAFFSEPFFTLEVDDAVLDELRNPVQQQKVRRNPTAQANKEALRVALLNLKKISRCGGADCDGHARGPARPVPRLL